MYEKKKLIQDIYTDPIVWILIVLSIGAWLFSEKFILAAAALCIVSFGYLEYSIDYNEYTEEG